MPIKVVCSNCGHQLAYYGSMKEVSYVSDFTPYYQKISSQYNGKCPKCGHKLASEPLNVEVKGLEKPDRAFFTMGKYVKRK